jgi:cytosine/adenosine deaminase-related metal-dependent hydrolase
MAHSGAVAGLCPTTEANLGDGIFPALTIWHRKGAGALAQTAMSRSTWWKSYAGWNMVSVCVTSGVIG